MGAHALFAAQAGTLLAMTAAVGTRYWQDHGWLGPALIAIAALAWIPELRQRRVRLGWFAYVAGIFVYTILRSLADETLIPSRALYPIEADHLLFLGGSPVTLLQRGFDPSHVSWLDVSAVQVHWSFFIAPHALAVFVFWRHREQFAGYTAAVVGTMYLGLLLFFLVPTVPPWLAAQQGHLDGVYRVMDFVGGRVDSQTYQSFYASLGEPNSVAAMPSIHMGVTVAMYLWARRERPRLAMLLLPYCAVMGLALVYLAEHYVLDLAVGALCALVAANVAGRLGLAPFAAQPTGSGRALVDARAACSEADLM